MRSAALILAVAALLAQAGGALAADPAVLAGTYAAAPPTQMGAGTDVPVPVTVTNTGNVTWNPCAPPKMCPVASGSGPVDLSYHWYDQAGSVVVWDGVRTALGTVAPGASATATALVHVPTASGMYILRFALVEEGVAWLAPSQPFPVQVVPAYSAAIAPPQVPSLVTGQTYTVAVTLSNAGTAAWSAAGPTPVDLSYHWYDAKGDTLVWDGLRTPLPADVRPGGTVTLHAQVTAPLTPGALRLEFDLVREGVAWFRSLGSTPASVAVTVAPVTYAAQYGVAVSAASYIGETSTIPVAVTNTGNVAWGGQSPVNLGYHILGASGSALVWDGTRTPLGTLAPGASETVQLTYTSPTTIGTYTLVIDAVREGVAWFSSIGTPPVRLPMRVTSGFGAGYGATTTPAAATIGALLTLDVAVNNYGPRTLPAGGADPVHLSYHLLDAAGDTVVWDGSRGVLPGDVPPGGSATVELDVQMPRTVGDYVIAWDLVQEGVGWFSQLGVPPKKEPVTVQPGVTFYGKGFGHALGMSQWGAEGMATGAGGKPPMSALQIVSYYYPGTQLGAIPAGSPNTVIRVLLSQPSSQGRYTCGAAYFDGSIANVVSYGGFKVLNEGANNAVIFTAGPNVTVQMQATAGVVKVWDQATPTPTMVYAGPGPVVTVPLDATKPTDIVEKGWYRGNFRFTDLGDTLRILNVVSYDDYVRGVVPLEMLKDWSLEAYKAQALAARSYAYSSYQGGARDYDVSDDQSSQCYGGVQMTSGRTVESPITDAAAAQTAGMFIEYQGQPIRAYFSSSDGGYTNAWGCWGNNPVVSPTGVACASSPPYITPVADPWDLLVSVPTTNKYASWQVTFTSDQVRGAVQSMQGIDIGPLRSVDLSNRYPAVVGHVVSVRLTGAYATVDLPADKLLRGYLYLRSTMVRLAPW